MAGEKDVARAAPWCMASIKQSSIWRTDVGGGLVATEHGMSAVCNLALLSFVVVMSSTVTMDYRQNVVEFW